MKEKPKSFTITSSRRQDAFAIWFAAGVGVCWLLAQLSEIAAIWFAASYVVVSFILKISSRRRPRG